MKKLLSSILILGIYTALSIFPCNATNNSGPACAISQSQSITLKINENNSNYDLKWNEAHNRLLINSDFVEKYFNAEVKINNNSIDIYKNGHTLHFENDNEFYTMDNLGGRKIDCIAEINKDKAYLPLRYLCEAFGASIKYESTAQTVAITPDAIVMDDSIKSYFENVQVFDQSTIRITGEKTVYVDPRRVLGEPHDADIIFITHTHNDHYEIDTIKRIIKPSTLVYISMDGVEQAKNDGLKNVIGVTADTDYEADGIKFHTVTAYNTSADRQNHKKEFNWIGYIFTINGYTYYSAGDTDFTQEMKNITIPVDVAFLPIDGKYNMDFNEAAKAANAIKPKIAVPYHYNNFVSEYNAEEFVNQLDEDIKGAIVTFKMQ